MTDFVDPLEEPLDVDRDPRRPLDPDVDEALVTGLAQPDQRSCGPSALVAARMLVDPTYADRFADDRTAGFATETLAVHRRVTALVPAGGDLQIPWPRMLGTPPWAVARAMSTFSGPDLPAVDYAWTDEDEALVDALVPRGHPSTPGYTDPAYPLRPRRG